MNARKTGRRRNGRCIDGGRHDWEFRFNVAEFAEYACSKCLKRQRIKTAKSGRQYVCCR